MTQSYSPDYPGSPRHNIPQERQESVCFRGECERARPPGHRCRRGHCPSWPAGRRNVRWQLGDFAVWPACSTSRYSGMTATRPDSWRMRAMGESPRASRNPALRVAPSWLAARAPRRPQSRRTGGARVGDDDLRGLTGQAVSRPHRPCGDQDTSRMPFKRGAAWCGYDLHGGLWRHSGRTSSSAEKPDPCLGAHSPLPQSRTALRGSGAPVGAT